MAESSRQQLLRRWGDENVVDDSKEEEDYVARNADPETEVLQQLLIVSTEEDEANGHTGRNSSQVSHK